MDEQYPYIKDRVLWVTEVGSRMWRMETYASDRDKFFCFQFPTCRILEGHRIPTSMPQKGWMGNDGLVVDAGFMEIGHLVNLLLKGNVNTIWGVMSPVCEKGGAELDLLRGIVSETLSKKSFFSIQGMAVSQMCDIKKRECARDPNKSRATALRTLRFGIALMKGTISFQPVRDIPTEEEINGAFDELKSAYEHSTLPPTVSEEPFRRFLYQCRVADFQLPKK